MDEDDKPKHPRHADLYLYGWMEHRRLFHRNGVKSFKHRNFKHHDNAVGTGMPGGGNPPEKIFL